MANKNNLLSLHFFPQIPLKLPRWSGHFAQYFSLFSFIGWLRLPSSAFIQSKHFWIEWMAAGGESKQNNLFSSSIIHLWEWWKREIGLLSFNKLIDAPREKTINGKKSETHQSSFNSKNEEIDWASFLFFPRGSLQSTNWKCFICWWRSKAMAQPTNNNLFFFLTALARADKRRLSWLGLPRSGAAWFSAQQSKQHS